MDLREQTTAFTKIFETYIGFSCPIILQNNFDISSISRFLKVESYVVDFDNLSQPLETAMPITLKPEMKY